MSFELRSLRDLYPSRRCSVVARCRLVPASSCSRCAALPVFTPAHKLTDPSCTKHRDASHGKPAPEMTDQQASTSTPYVLNKAQAATKKLLNFVQLNGAAPVGAARRMSFCCLSQRRTMVLVAKVLPQPGPPVSTTSGAVLACSTAAFCPSLSPAACPAQPHEKQPLQNSIMA